jgi:hypothetical protein
MVAAFSTTSPFICCLSNTSAAGIEYFRSRLLVWLQTIPLISSGRWFLGFDLSSCLWRLETSRAHFNDPPYFVFFLWSYLSFAKGSRDQWILFVSAPDPGSDLDEPGCFGDLAHVAEVHEYYKDDSHA